MSAPSSDRLSSQRLTLAPHEKDLGGGFLVRRTLPSAQRQAVGPFLFFDHFGPITAKPGDNHDVRPHPHIGLATVTYLFEGAMMHRDSTGIVQRIDPGAINWMTAGRGIVHSERSPDELRGSPMSISGLQTWLALPDGKEEVDPLFENTASASIPHFDAGGVSYGAFMSNISSTSGPIASRTARTRVTSSASDSAPVFSFTARYPSATKRAYWSAQRSSGSFSR